MTNFRKLKVNSRQHAKITRFDPAITSPEFRVSNQPIRAVVRPGRRFAFDAAFQ